MNQPADPNELIYFCVRCFASEDNSSWGETLTSAHCYNCGASNSSVQLQRYAVTSIRQQASWVGKRHYPHEEDVQNQLELKRLRNNMTSFPGRYAERSASDHPDDVNNWTVTQITPTGRTMIFVHAASEEEALDKAKALLPYYNTAANQ